MPKNCKVCQRFLRADAEINISSFCYACMGWSWTFVEFGQGWTCHLVAACPSCLDNLGPGSEHDAHFFLESRKLSIAYLKTWTGPSFLYSTKVEGLYIRVCLLEGFTTAHVSSSQLIEGLSNIINPDTRKGSWVKLYLFFPLLLYFSLFHLQNSPPIPHFPTTLLGCLSSSFQSLMQGYRRGGRAAEEAPEQL